MKKLHSRSTCINVYIQVGDKGVVHTGTHDSQRADDSSQTTVVGYDTHYDYHDRL